MTASLSFVEKDTVAEVLVSDRPPSGKKGGGEKEVQVRFSVDGKRKRAVMTVNGLASLELGSLKPGLHTVLAEVVGDTARDQGEVVVKPKTVGFWGGLAMVLYLVLFGYWWGYPAYTTTALAITFLIFFARTMFQHRDGAEAEEMWATFWAQLGDNNWVLRTATWMFLVAGFLWWVDPTAPEVTLNPIEWIKNQVMSLGSGPLEDPLGEFGFWGTISRWFFGPEGVGPTVLWILFWGVFWAVWVSRWDEVKDGLKKIGEGKGGVSGAARLAAHHTLGEIVTQPLEWAWHFVRGKK